jgi:inhibitor of nuclear factor kappa-B kinase subunit alpha
MLSFEDKILIKNLRECKNYSSRRLIKEFPNKNWKRKTLDDFLRKLRTTGSVERAAGSGRPKSSRTEDNIAAVNELVQSQEDKPKTHLSTRQIARELNLTQTTVRRIIHNDLELKCLKRRRAQELTTANRQSRLVRARQLLQRFSVSDVGFIFFTDEKLFTVAAPSNTQNDRLYVPRSVSKKQISSDRLLRTRTTFSKSLMVSVGISKLGRTELIFVDPGAKINGQYYRDVMLAQHLLPQMRHIAGDMFIFQQDSAPAHRARETIEYLSRNAPYFIGPEMWPPNSPDLNPLDYSIWSIMEQRVYQQRIQNTDELRQCLVSVWNDLEQHLIDTAIDQWRRRLAKCVREKGSHFEHKL